MEDLPKEQTTFTRNKTLTNMYSLFAVLGVAVLVIGIVMGKGIPPISIVLTVLGIIMFATRNKPIVSLHENHFEAKLAPLAPLKMHKYADIADVRIEKKRIICNITNQKKALKLPVNQFNKQDIEPLLDALKNAVTNSKEQA